MLKLKYLFENYDLAKEALKNWNYDSDTLDKMLSQFRISSNAIYPFCQDGKTCFLRLAPTEEKLEKNVFGEMEFIKYLLDCGYQALKPVKALNGQECLILHTQWGDYYATAFYQVDGVQIEDTDLSKDIIYEYGKTLGKLHALSAGFKPIIKKWTHIEVLDWVESVLQEYHAPEAMVSESADLRAALGLLSQGKENYGLVHYDFELDNVFYDKVSKSCSVIDFDDGMYHWYALDVEQAFDSLGDELDSMALQEAEKEFIRGYNTEYSYTSDMEASRQLMRRFMNLYGYARLIRCVAERFPNEPDWLIGLREKLNQAIFKKEASVTGM